MVLSCSRASSSNLLWQINNVMIVRRLTLLICGWPKFNFVNVLTTSVLSCSWSSLSSSITQLKNVWILRKCMMVLISSLRTNLMPIVLLTSFLVKFLADLRRQSNLFLRISETTVSTTSIHSLKKLHRSVKMTLLCCQSNYQRTWEALAP